MDRLGGGQRRRGQGCDQGGGEAAQFILFGLLSVLTAVFWWQRQRSASKPSDQPGLNQRGSEFVGRTFALHEAISGGRGKIKAGDSLWLVTGPDMPAGMPVRVVGQNGVVLRVEAEQSV